MNVSVTQGPCTGHPDPRAGGGRPFGRSKNKPSSACLINTAEAVHVDSFIWYKRDPGITSGTGPERGTSAGGCNGWGSRVPVRIPVRH
jgi:hypothetical protein